MLATSSSQILTIQLLTAKVPLDFALERSKFRNQFPQFAVEARKTPDFHDRFIITDDRRCWHIGASIKDAGRKAFMMSEVEDLTNRDALRQAFGLSWSKGSVIVFP